MSTILLAVSAVLVPVSAVAGWARLHVQDEDAFVVTFGPLATDPAVQNAVIGETTAAIAARVDFDALTRQIVDGLADLGLGPRATAALRLLQQPAAAGLRGAMEDAVDSVVRSSEFAALWSGALHVAHRAMTTAATIDGGEVIALTDRGVVLRLGPLVDRARDRLGGVSDAVPSLIPRIDREVVVASGATLSNLRTGYAAVVSAGWWSPLLSVALLGAAVAVARRRVDAIIGVGGTLVFGALLLWGLIAVGGSVAAATARDSVLWTSAIEAAYGRVVLPLDTTARIIAVVGAAVALSAGATRWLLARARADRGRAAPTEASTPS